MRGFIKGSFRMMRRRSFQPFLFFALLLSFACKSPSTPSREPPQRIEAGFSSRQIVTAENFSSLFETYTDLDGNGYFDGCPDTPLGPLSGKPYCAEPFDDRNKNGWFDGAFLAGFGSSRPAQGVHDPIEVRAYAIRVGKKLAIFATLDAIGYHYSEVEKIQRMIRSQGISYDLFIMSSTHDHEAPDPMGQWGPDTSTDLDFPITTGALPFYLERIRDLTVEAVKEAVGKLRPVEFCIATTSSAENPLFLSYPELKEIFAPWPDSLVEGLENDWRDPFVINHTLVGMLFRDRETSSPIGVVANIHSHAESLWDENVLVTADYPGYVRKRLEQNFPGAVGIHVSGSVGGIIGPHDVPVWLRDEAGNRVTDPFTGLPVVVSSNDYLDRARSLGYSVRPDATFDKARSLGYEYADLISYALKDSPLCFSEGYLDTAFVEFLMPIQNPAFIFGGFLRIFPRTIYDKNGNPLEPVSFEVFRAFGSYPPEGIGYVRTAIGGAVLSRVDGHPVVTIISAPGEMFSETVWGLPPDLNDPSQVQKYWPQGRDKHAQNYTLQYTLKDFLFSDFLFLYGLGNDELGYLVPESDFIRYHPLFDSEPPDHYEESNSVGPKNEEMLKDVYTRVFSSLRAQVEERFR
jgi:hypothetical protein